MDTNTPAPAASSLPETLARARRCVGTRTDGGSCGAPARRSSPFCFLHDPASAEASAAARSAGGIARRLPRARDVLQAELERVAAELAPAIIGTYTAALEATRLQSIGFQVIESPDHAVRMRAADTLLERQLGKPASSVEVSGAGGGPLTLAMLLVDDARDTIAPPDHTR